MEFRIANELAIELKRPFFKRSAMTILNKLAVAVQSLALHFGVVIKRSNYYSREDLRLLRFLEVHQIDTVLDVGANRGDYAADLIKGGFKGRIYSFEALPDMHKILMERASSISDHWIIAPRCAISNEDGTATFHVTKASSSSSLLSPSRIVNDMAEIFSVEAEIEVPTRTIASLVAELGISSNRMFLKLDIQGGEEKALKGADAVLHQIVGLVAEMALREYYDGQASVQTLHSWICNRGFELWDIQPVWREPQTGRLDHIDQTYFRSI